MGATVLVRRYAGEYQDMASSVESLQAQDAHEDGHSYSGSWGSLYSGLNIEDPIFATFHDAQEYISDHHQKGESPMAVRFLGHAKNKKGFSDYNKKFCRLQSLRAKVGTQEGSILRKAANRALEGKSATRSCKQCGTRHPTHSRFLLNMVCSCGDLYLLNSAERERYETFQGEIAALERELMDRVRNEPKSAPCFDWAIGGNCPS